MLVPSTTEHENSRPEDRVLRRIFNNLGPIFMGATDGFKSSSNQVD